MHTSSFLVLITKIVKSDMKILFPSLFIYCSFHLCTPI